MAYNDIYDMPSMNFWHRIDMEQCIQETLFPDLEPELLRGIVPYVGGKGLMLNKLVPLIESIPHQVYVEPCVGGGSVFMAKTPSPVEVINDIDDSIINIFRVLQEPQKAEALKHRLMYTPYARSEFAKAIGLLEDAEPVTKAWATFVVRAMAFGGLGQPTIGAWGRGFISRSGVASMVNKWLMRLTMLDAWRWRIMMAQIENRDMLEVIQYWDKPETLFYIDPPYLLEKRPYALYANEASVEQHQQLVRLLLQLQGQCVLSAYTHPVYQPLLDNGWQYFTYQTVCHATSRSRKTQMRGEGSLKRRASRIECLFIRTHHPITVKTGD